MSVKIERNNGPTKLDWLTLATYKFKAYTDLAAILRRNYYGEWYGGNWLQYKGYRSKLGMFYGDAVQSNNKTHYVMQVSGEISQEIATLLLKMPDPLSWYATRMDLQKTIPMQEWWNVRHLYDWIKENGKTASSVQSDSGDTLYIGSRQSERFTRIYEKDYGSKWLRLEIELKQGHARNAWEHLVNGKAPNEIYQAHLEKLPIPSRVYESYFDNTGDDLDISLDRQESDDMSKMRWLKTLLPTLEKMAGSHNIGRDVRTIFYHLSLTNEEEENYE